MQSEITGSIKEGKVDYNEAMGLSICLSAYGSQCPHEIISENGFDYDKHSGTYCLNLENGMSIMAIAEESLTPFWVLINDFNILDFKTYSECLTYLSNNIN